MRFIFARRTCYHCWGDKKVISITGDWKTCPTCKGKGYVEE